MCLLSAADGFKDVVSTFEPLPFTRDGAVLADSVLSCAWSADSRLLLVACTSSAVYLLDRCGVLAEAAAAAAVRACTHMRRQWMAVDGACWHAAARSANVFPAA